MIGTADVANAPRYCAHCGLHHGPVCPRIKAIEYYPDGSVKRVEYLVPAPVDAHGPTFGLSADDLHELARRR
jgi:hypothetical protein